MRANKLVYTSLKARAAASFISHLLPKVSTAEMAALALAPQLEIACHALASDASLHSFIEYSTGTGYVLDRAAEILHPDFHASDADLIQISARTSAAVETEYSYGDALSIRLSDIGHCGSPLSPRRLTSPMASSRQLQRAGHLLDDQHVVLFMASLGEYDVIAVDGQCRLDAALDYFGALMDLHGLCEAFLILFLTHADVFREKLEARDLSCWDAAACDLDYQSACQFVGDRFRKRLAGADERLRDEGALSRSRDLHIEYVCTTDTHAMEVALRVCHELIWFSPVSPFLPRGLM